MDVLIRFSQDRRPIIHGIEGRITFVAPIVGAGLTLLSDNITLMSALTLTFIIKKYIIVSS